MSPLLAIDTSVAVPLLVQTHVAHLEVVRWWDRREVHLAGHALAETYAVLTRLPVTCGWIPARQPCCCRSASPLRYSWGRRPPTACRAC